ncbi:DUF4184 family protein [Methylomagnum ishizawai]|uniref:DUF4184 family protein n=1 Tax=Methylomagnum ishizawai TaxID=1760988 RepID=UPI001C32068B|nr:DUF4184 family protein [Methylomagnum ishizawai]BBL73397.1 hypothetical protein MishRS11D_04950 [Methylomagnum ishizawai]
MPWTFAHPAAVLPLWPYCPAWLRCGALVAGSLSPDLGYYLQRFDWATLAHTGAGSLLVGLPSGLCLYGLAYGLRKPLCHALPQPHRAALWPLTQAPGPSRPGEWVALAVSVVLGAWTHTGWDSLTHRDGWVVAKLAWLRESMRIGGTEFPVYALLQQFSTVAGTLILLACYRAWLRAQPAPAPSWQDDRGRYLLGSLAALAALIAAVLVSLPTVADIQGTMAVRVLAFQLAVHGTAIFLPLFTLGALVFYGLSRPPSNDSND